VTVTVEGADRLAATMHAAADDLGDLTGTHTLVASMIAGRVNPPRLTGALAASITGRGSPTEAVVGSSLVYAPVHEYGWPRRHIRARRYLSAAFAASTADATRAYERAVADAVSQIRGA
jgi:phage gpG-like protein